MDVQVTLLNAADRSVLDTVAPGVFDRPVDPQWTAEFLADPHHHLAVAVQSGRVVGMASAVHYLHPDKPPELWVNEVGVAASFRRRGLGSRLLDLLFRHAQTLGCVEAWILTEAPNQAARALYTRAGGVEAERPVYVTFALADVVAHDGDVDGDVGRAAIEDDGGTPT